MATRQEWYTLNDDDGTNWVALADERAQSFTLGTTGNNITFVVTTIQVKLYKNGTPTSTMVWEIQEADPAGEPNGTVVSTGTLDVTGILAATPGSWKTITMSAGTLEAGKQYVLIGKDGYTGVGDQVVWRLDNSSPTYTGGNNLRSSDSGVTWTQYTSDCMFQINGGTYAGTLCTLADAVNKAGGNAAPGAKDEGLVSDYVRQAEATVNAITHYNWINKYSSLTDDVKYILNDLTSNLAAIYIITYDMSGYTDRVEAETMINVYRDAALRQMSLLRDQNVKEFIIGDV